MTKTERIIAIFLAILISAAILIVCNADAEKIEIETGWIICETTTRVNIRSHPSNHSQIYGFIECGEEIHLDGIRDGHWVHIIDAGTESDEGWVYDGYITDSPVTIETHDCETTVAKLRVRKCIDGKITKTLRKGTSVTVYAMSADWAITNKGYIKTEFLQIEGSNET